jgi:hypothetical protein
MKSRIRRGDFHSHALASSSQAYYAWEDFFEEYKWRICLVAFRSAFPRRPMSDLATWQPPSCIYAGHKVAALLDEAEAPELFRALADYERDAGTGNRTESRANWGFLVLNGRPL